MLKPRPQALGSLPDYLLDYEDLVVVGNYMGHIKCVEAFLELGLDRKVAILDLAAVTGLLGAEVTCRGARWCW